MNEKNSLVREDILNFLDARNKVSEQNVFLVKMALRASIVSSTRNNTIYLSQRTKSTIRNKWERLLLEYSGKKYLSIMEYADDVHVMKTSLSNEFGMDISVKLSHTQKSLSLFLKYLWCYGLIERPIACPIDCGILTIAKAKDQTISICKWTDLDDKDEYLKILNALHYWAEGTTVAEKEIEYWNNN